MRVHALRLYYLVAFCALGVYLPFFPRWLEAQGIDGASMGAIAAAFPAMAIIAPPAFGLLADALRLRRALLRVACAGAFACSCCHPHWPSGGRTRCRTGFPGHVTAADRGHSCGQPGTRPVTHSGSRWGALRGQRIPGAA